MKQLLQAKTFLFLVAVVLAVFAARTALAAGGSNPPMLDHLFVAITLAGSLAVLATGYRRLHASDWLAAVFLGAVVGVGMLFATLFSAYPFFGIVHSRGGLALARGLSVALAALGGLVIMRMGGPVQSLAAAGDWGKTGRGVLFGLVTGLPLAVLNVFALQMTQGRSAAWQNPAAALLDALQPGIVEEVIYRFALWGLLWLVLRGSMPAQAATLAGLLATVIHGYAHFDTLFVQSPLAALGMGLVMTVVWGLPLFFLARRRGLEAAIAFHWIQDVARFVTGF